MMSGIMGLCIGSRECSGWVDVTGLVDMVLVSGVAVVGIVSAVSTDHRLRCSAQTSVSFLPGVFGDIFLLGCRCGLS